MYGKRTVRAYIHRAKFELYDLQNDPDEVVNLANSDEHQGLLKKMQDEMKQFQQKTNDPWKMKWNYE